MKDGWMDGRMISAFNDIILFSVRPTTKDVLRPDFEASA